MKWLIKILMGLFAGCFALGAANIPLIPQAVDCRMSLDGVPVYDTPSGKLESGYWDPLLGYGDPPSPPSATSSKGFSPKIAKQVGTRAFTLCWDTKGNRYEFPLTKQEYLNLGLKGAGKPPKSILVPITSL